MKNLFIAILLLIAGTTYAQNIQKVISGRIDHLENFPSKLVEPRSVDIWLPDGYDGKKKFEVLYMHDGQMLFDSTTTWNHQTWNMDDVASQLMKDQKVHNFIVGACTATVKNAMQITFLSIHLRISQKQKRILLLNSFRNRAGQPKSSNPTPTII